METKQLKSRTFFPFLERKKQYSFLYSYEGGPSIQKLGLKTNNF